MQPVIFMIIINSIMKWNLKNDGSSFLLKIMLYQNPTSLFLIPIDKGTRPKSPYNITFGVLF